MRNIPDKDYEEICGLLNETQYELWIKNLKDLIPRAASRVPANMVLLSEHTTKEMIRLLVNDVSQWPFLIEEMQELQEIISKFESDNLEPLEEERTHKEILEIIIKERNNLKSEYSTLTEIEKVLSPYLELHPEYGGPGLCVINDMVGELLARDRDDNRKHEPVEESVTEKQFIEMGEILRDRAKGGESYIDTFYRLVGSENNQLIKALKKQNDDLTTDNYELEITIKTIMQLSK